MKANQRMSWIWNMFQGGASDDGASNKEPVNNIPVAPPIHEAIVSTSNAHSADTNSEAVSDNDNDNGVVEWEDLASPESNDEPQSNDATQSNDTPQSNDATQSNDTPHDTPESNDVTQSNEPQRSGASGYAHLGGRKRPLPDPLRFPFTGKQKKEASNESCTDNSRKDQNTEHSSSSVTITDVVEDDSADPFRPFLREDESGTISLREMFPRRLRRLPPLPLSLSLPVNIGVATIETTPPLPLPSPLPSLYCSDIINPNETTSDDDECKEQDSNSTPHKYAALPLLLGYDETTALKNTEQQHAGDCDRGEKESPKIVQCETKKCKVPEVDWDAIAPNCKYIPLPSSASSNEDDFFNSLIANASNILERDSDDDDDDDSDEAAALRRASNSPIRSYVEWSDSSDEEETIEFAAPAPTPLNDMESILEVPKTHVVCLHDYGQTPEMMRSQVQPLIDATRHLNWHFHFRKGFYANQCTVPTFAAPSRRGGKGGRARSKFGKRRRQGGSGHRWYLHRNFDSSCASQTQNAANFASRSIGEQLQLRQRRRVCNASRTVFGYHSLERPTPTNESILKESVPKQEGSTALWQRKLCRMEDDDAMNRLLLYGNVSTYHPSSFVRMGESVVILGFGEGATLALDIAYQNRQDFDGSRIHHSPLIGVIAISPQFPNAYGTLADERDDETMIATGNNKWRKRDAYEQCNLPVTLIAAQRNKRVPIQKSLRWQRLFRNIDTCILRSIRHSHHQIPWTSESIRRVKSMFAVEPLAP